MKLKFDQADAALTRLTFAAAYLQLNSVMAMRHPDASIRFTMCARLVLATRPLLTAMGETPYVMSCCKKESDPDAPTPKFKVNRFSLEQIELEKQRMIRAWNATESLGVVGLRHAIPAYFESLEANIDSILTSAEQVYARKPLPAEISSAGSMSADAIYYHSESALRVLPYYYRGSRGARRGNMALAMMLLDDAQKLAYGCTRDSFPFEQEGDGISDPMFAKIEAALQQVDPQELSGPVHQHLVTVVRPIAQALFEKALSVSPEASNPDRIAFLD